MRGFLPTSIKVHKLEFSLNFNQKIQTLIRKLQTPLIRKSHEKHTYWKTSVLLSWLQKLKILPLSTRNPFSKQNTRSVRLRYWPEVQPELSPEFIILGIAAAKIIFCQLKHIFSETIICRKKWTKSDLVQGIFYPSMVSPQCCSETMFLERSFICQVFKREKKTWIHLGDMWHRTLSRHGWSSGWSPLLWLGQCSMDYYWYVESSWFSYLLLRM